MTDTLNAQDSAAQGPTSERVRFLNTLRALDRALRSQQNQHLELAQSTELDPRR